MSNIFKFYTIANASASDSITIKTLVVVSNPPMSNDVKIGP